MHELSLAQSILQATLDEAKRVGGKPIGKIQVKVRESGHILEAYSLQTLLGVIVKGTPAEGAKIKIEVIPPTLRCKACDFTFPAQDGTLICPRCRGGNLEALDADKIDIECNLTE